MAGFTADSFPRIVHAATELPTSGTCNALLFVVASTVKSEGWEDRWMTAVEAEIKSHGGRILFVETSSGDELQTARLLYLKLCFREESRPKTFMTKAFTRSIIEREFETKKPRFANQGFS